METLEQLTKRLRQVDELSQQTHTIISKSDNINKREIKNSSEKHLEKEPPTTQIDHAAVDKKGLSSSSLTFTPVVPRTLSKQFGLSNERRLNKNAAAAAAKHKPTFDLAKHINFPNITQIQNNNTPSILSSHQNLIISQTDQTISRENYESREAHKDKMNSLISKSSPALIDNDTENSSDDKNSEMYHRPVRNGSNSNGNFRKSRNHTTCLSGTIIHEQRADNNSGTSQGQLVDR